MITPCEKNEDKKGYGQDYGIIASSEKDGLQLALKQYTITTVQMGLFNLVRQKNVRNK